MCTSVRLKLTLFEVLHEQQINDLSRQPRRQEYTRDHLQAYALRTTTVPVMYRGVAQTGIFGDKCQDMWSGQGAVTSLHCNRWTDRCTAFLALVM